MKILNIALSLSLAMAASQAFADEYAVDFSQGIPRSITCSNVDGGDLSRAVYRVNVPNGASWFWGRVASNDAAALCPTSNEDGTPRISRLTLPLVSVDEDNAILCWDARSFLKHVPEAYRVYIRISDSDEWREVMYVGEETYTWSTRFVNLDPYVGKEIQVAFESATDRYDAFMFAIDNIFIGTPNGMRYRYTPAAVHYVANGEKTVVRGELASYGADPGWKEIILVDADDPDNVISSCDFPAMAIGDVYRVELELVVPDNSTIKYKILGRYADGFTMTLAQDFVTSSLFRRTQFLDRYTGTWCNNCTKEELTVNRYRERFGDQMIVVEAHVRDIDALTCNEYWEGLGSECVFSVPQLMINHNRASVNSSKDYQKVFNNDLTYPVTIAGVESQARLLDDRRTVRISSETRFAEDIDNSLDTYRVAYMLVADVHDPNNANYAQSNNAVGTDWEEYGYMPNLILPKMRYFTNVVVEASTAINGVPASLPATIAAGETLTHTFELDIPDEYATMPIHAIAMLIDRRDGQVVNSCLANGGSALDSVETLVADGDMTDGAVYDLMGRRVTTTDLAPGVYIASGRKFVVK